VPAGWLPGHRWLSATSKSRLLAGTRPSLPGSNRCRPRPAPGRLGPRYPLISRSGKPRGYDRQLLSRQVNFKPEPAPFFPARSTPAGLPPISLHQLTADRQSQTCAFDAADHFPRLLKGQKDSLQLIRRNPGPRVLNLKSQVAPNRRLPVRLQPLSHPPTPGR